MLKGRWSENLKALILGLACFLLILLLFIFAQDLSSSKFIYVDF